MRKLTPEQARAIRRKHWPDEQWNDIIGSVVDEVFGMAEVDEGTLNPQRLNSANRTRWLCERTMRSDKRIGEMAEQQQMMMEKLDALIKLAGQQAA
jgi:hypothetical protein